MAAPISKEQYDASIKAFVAKAVTLGVRRGVKLSVDDFPEWMHGGELTSFINAFNKLPVMSDRALYDSLPERYRSKVTKEKFVTNRNKARAKGRLS